MNRRDVLVGAVATLAVVSPALAMSEKDVKEADALLSQRRPDVGGMPYV